MNETDRILQQGPFSPLKPQPRRPLLGVAIAFAFGILAAFLFLPPIRLSASLTIVLALAALVLRARLPVVSYVLVLAAVAAVGTARFSFRADLQALSGSQVGQAAPFPAKVRGAVEELPEATILDDVAGTRSEQVRIRFPLRVESLYVEDAWRPFTGTIQVSGLEEGAQKSAAAGTSALSALRYGDRVELACELSRLPRPGNPGEFDYGAYLAQQGIEAVASVPAGVGARLLEERAGLAPLRWIYDAKQHMRSYLDERLSADQSALLKCLVLGDRRARSRAQEEPYVRTGTVHFLAVSGFNVVLLALPIWYILALAKVGLRAASVVVMIVVALYAVIAGLNPPVVRASVMVAVVCGGYFLKRQSNFLNSICLAAIIVLLINPADLLSAGFQLSFVCVLSISLFAGRLRRLIFGRRDFLEQLKPDHERMEIIHYPGYWLETGLCASLAASLASVGLVALYFHMVAPLSPILTLIETPLVCLITCIGFPVVLLGPLLGGVMTPLAWLAGFLAQVFDTCTVVFSRLPGARIFVGEWGAFWTIMFYAFFLTIVLAPRLRLRAAHVAMIGILLACGYAAVGLLPRAQGYGLTMLDVGEGCATLIRLPDGANLLNDCGSGGDPTVGRRVIAPFLWRKGVRRLDVVIISHADSDHWNGLEDVVERFRIGRVVVPEAALNTPEGARLADMLQRNRVEVQAVSAGDQLQIGEQTRIEILGPIRSAAALAKMSPNNLSCVARLIRPEATMLLTGDVQEAGIAILMSRQSDLRADVLLASHHGHAIGNLSLFLSAVQPRMVLVSGWQIAPAYRMGRWSLLDTGSKGALSLAFTHGQEQATQVVVRTGAREQPSLTEAWAGGRSQQVTHALEGL